MRCRSQTAQGYARAGSSPAADLMEILGEIVGADLNPLDKLFCRQEHGAAVNGPGDR